MSMSFNEIPHSHRLSPLDVSTSESADKQTGKKGIRAHNEVSNFVLNFLSLFGVKKVVNIQDKSGNFIHLNRASVDKWLERHKGNYHNLSTDAEYKAAIEEICNNTLKNLQSEKSKLLDNTIKKVEEFKKDKLDNYVQQPFSYQKDGQIHSTRNETVALGDAALNKKPENYAIDGRAIGYVGINHPICQLKYDDKKIFGGAGMKIHISIDPTIPGNRFKAFEALEPILCNSETGVVQYKVFSESSKAELEKWFNDAPPHRPGGQQGKEITLYLVDEEQIQKAIKAGATKEQIETARKFVKTPEQIAELITTCLKTLEDAGVQGFGYMQNVSDKYLNAQRSVGIRDDRKADGSLDNYAYVGEHAHGNYVNGVPQWDDPSDKIITALNKDPQHI